MSSPKILIIDDEQNIHALLADILRKEGYELFHAFEGEEGLSKVRSIQPDLIFLDMRMPVLDGLSFLKEMNRLSISTCPVIALTAYNDEMVLSECYDQGVVAIIRKPFPMWEITALTRRYTSFNAGRAKLSSPDVLFESLNGQATFQVGNNVWQKDFLEAIPLPVFIKNNDRFFVLVNTAFEKVTGLAKDDLVGKKCCDFEQLKLFERVEEQEKDLLCHGGVFRNEETLFATDGKQYDFICHRSAIKMEEGNEVAGIVGILIETSDIAFTTYKKRLALKFPDLSPRECEVAHLVRLGQANKEVAKQLGITLSTVEFHRSNLREKLGIKGDNVSLSTMLLTL